MQTRTKLLLAALAATALLSLAISDASARRFQVSSQIFRITWTSLEFDTASGTRTLCPVTLEGSFHSRTLSKVSGQLIGYISRAFIRGGNGAGECIGGKATILSTSPPWHVQYNSFTGTLPNITGIILDIIGARFQIEAAGVLCLLGTTQIEPLLARIATNSVTGVATEVIPDPTQVINIGNQGFFCELAGPAHFEGTGEAFVLGSTTTRITVRLVQ